MDIRKSLGSSIRKQRIASHISQEELAGRIDADQAYVSRLEAGRINPTATTLQQIATALGVELKTLFDNRK